MGRAERQFLNKTMRNFATLRNPGFVPNSGASAFPADWFDLSPKILADFGALYYLASLSPFNRDRSLAAITAQLEPPLRLKQYRIFRSKGYPRAFITWAGMSPAHERDFAVDHQPIAPHMWNSGTSKWLIDFVAPFGQIDQIVPLLTRNPNETRVRTVWHNKTGTRRRIVEWSRPEPDDPVAVKSYGVGQFTKLVDEV
ncbi:MAG: toxin-activating lysine-acyltransferase [Rhodobacteraceae bacterium]|nr:toxin-activating lysine-acyltransferase [Paracoccaceae bacterium]